LRSRPGLVRMAGMVRKSGFPEEALFPAAESPRSEGSPGQESSARLLRSYPRILWLKRLYRQGWLKRDVPEGACESVADHSFGTAALALLTAGRPPFQDADPGKSCLMAIVHEFGEVYAGDITPVDGVSKKEKYDLERESLLRVLDGIPGSGDFVALWEEFEEGKSPEARLVKRLDRLEMGVQAAVYRADGFDRMEEFLESARGAVGDGFLGDILGLAEGAD